MPLLTYSTLLLLFTSECGLSVVVGKGFKLKGYKTSITVSALVITSDMVLVDFRRTQIKHLIKKDQKYTVTAQLTKPSEHVNVFLTCACKSPPFVLCSASR